MTTSPERRKGEARKEEVLDGAALIGHTTRACTTVHPVCDAILWDPLQSWKRKSGGQCNTLRKTIFRDAHVSTSEELFELTRNRILHETRKGPLDSRCLTKRIWQPCAHMNVLCVKSLLDDAT